MPVSIVVAATKNRCIGKDGDLVWKHPEDTQRMKALTVGKTVIMGRKTWESIPEKFRPLPNRKNIVVTRQVDYPLPTGVERIDSVENYIQQHVQDDLVLFGGASVYRDGLPLTDTIYMTEVDQVIEGDTFFPEIDPATWKETSREQRDGFAFVTYKRI